MKKAIKLPRKTKKGLKKSQLSKFAPGWNSKDIIIDNISKDPKRFSNRLYIGSFKGVFVTAHRMGKGI